jgi:A/G-specific adenine glycosylase
MPPASPEAVEVFRSEVWRHYEEHARDLPWRRTRDAYRIVVSEIMLQQTQVPRVVPKYGEFLQAFPTVEFLAAADIGAVLAVWQGLGYNRRALALHRLAGVVVSEHAGVIPHSVEELQRLPGIGYATAAAVCVYAYEQPLAFIETNVRTAFIHFFFQECSRVSDAELLPLVELTLDRERPRDWYYALMDYGARLKKTEPNPGRRSAHHTVQSPFAGSRRQARALVLRLLLQACTGGLSLDQLLAADETLATRGRHEVATILSTLVAEGFLTSEKGCFRVAS